MNANLDYALASARATELHRHFHEASRPTHGSLGERIRRRREAARRARARRSAQPRLRAA